MSSFGFGSQNTTVGGSSFAFGANKTNTPTFGLGNAGTNTGSIFGTPQSNAPTGLPFGTPTTTQSSGLFGTPVAGQNTGLTFGTPNTALNQTGGLSFGSLASTGLSFGTPNTSAPAPSLSFGTPATTAQSGFSFGTPTTTQAAPAFGSTTPQAGLFGSITTTAQSFAANPSALSFGVATTQSGLTFGTPATTCSALNFGAVTPSAGLFGSQPVGTTAATTTTGLSFGATPSTFGTVTSASGLNFTNPLSTTGPSLGFPSLTATSTTTTKSGGLFSYTPTTANSTSVGLSLPTFTGGSLFSKPTTTAAVTTTTPSVGLGGLDTAISKGLSSTFTSGVPTSRAESKNVKENLVPNEILQTIDVFKNFVKTQKGFSSDIARSSPKVMHKVQEDLDLLKQMLASVVSDLQRNTTLASKLKADTDKCLQNVEMAQKTHDTPPGLQFENTAPDKYFEDLITQFENQIQMYKQEVDRIEAHVNGVLNPKPLSTQELYLALKRLVDCFVALAGRLHTVHNMVENQKEQYLNLRKYFLKDSTNIFEDDDKKTDSTVMKPKMPSMNFAGPTAFSVLGNQQNLGLSTSLMKSPLQTNSTLGWISGQQQSSSLQQPQPLSNSGWGMSFGSNFLSGGGIGGGVGSSNTNILSTPQPVENQNFQLQKPPVGNKRGKK